MKAKAMNEVWINVKCNGDAVSITVDPFQAHAEKDQPMVWHVDAGADVVELHIGAGKDKWPFKKAAPYKIDKAKPASEKDRVEGWKRRTVRYTISGTCNGHDFVLDPDMIVD